MKKLIVLTMVVLSLAIVGCGKKKEPAQIIATDLQVLDDAMFQKLKADNKGKLIIFNFFASWCPPCKAETPDFISVYNEYKNKNFIIIGVSIDSKKQDAIDFVNEYGVTFPVYMADPALQRKYNVAKVPTSFIYDVDGSLANIAEGMISKSMLTKMAQFASQEVK